MEPRFQRKIFSLLVLASLFAPLFSNAGIIIPEASLTIVVNTQEQENIFDFKLQEYKETCDEVYDPVNDEYSYNCYYLWQDYENFSLQTTNLTAQKNFPYLTAFGSDRYRVVQETTNGLVIDTIDCISDDLSQSFAYEQNAVSYYPSSYSNTVCSFNNKKIADKTPVLIVPGIMGTEMFDGVEKLWADLDRMSYAVGDSFMDPLAFNENLTPVNPSVNDTDVIGVEKLFGANVFNYTEGLKNEFIGQGYVEGQTLFTFPYDWRYGISGKFNDPASPLGQATNVDLLKNKIESILAKTGKDKIDIVAHSMGGLLVKKYVIDNFTTDPVTQKINKAIFVGVPNLGSPEVVKTLVQGDSMDILFLNDAEIKKISQNMPGAYDLIPSQTYFNNYGSFVKTVEYTGLSKIEKDLNYQETKSFLIDDSKLNSIALTQSESLRTNSFDSYNLKTTGIDLYNIVGCKSSTMKKFVVQKNTDPLLTSTLTYDISETDNGDGTVPIESSNSVGASVGNTFYAIKTKHSDMLSADGSRQKIVNLITGANLTVKSNVISKVVLDANPEKCELSGWWLKWFSPVTIEVTDQNGNRSGIAIDGSIQNQIPGASYDIIGGHKFIFIPNDENQIYTINFKGDDAGVYTFTNSQIANGQTVKTEKFINLPVTSTLTGTVNLGNSTTPTTLTVKQTSNSEAQVIYPTPDDTIAPEVIIEFDPATKDLKFTGKDNLSLPSEITITDKDDTIILTDRSGNTTEIKLKDKNRKITMRAEVKSIKYNGKTADISKNKMAFLWLYDKKGNIKTLSQYVASKNGYNVLAIYDGKKTTLLGKDASGKIKKTEKGLKLLKVTTSNGDLVWSY